MALYSAAVESSANDPANAQAIERWLEELQDEHSPTRIERQLLSATSDDEIHRLLEDNRPLITPELGIQALREVRAMTTGSSAVPRILLGRMAELILHRVDASLSTIACVPNATSCGRAC